MASQATAAAENAAPLTLRTLGEAGLYAGDAAAPILGPGKPFALLVYLALTPGRRSSREFLLDLLWADLDPERARRALRQTLFHLRRLLGEETLSGTEELTLHGAIDSDRDGFLGDLERGEVEAALFRYHGAFLPTFGVPGGAAFEHWADLERDRLQTAFLRSADILVRRMLNESRFRDGQRLARRTRDLVPQRESAWRLVLEAAIAGSDFVGAAVEAEALQTWAESEGIALEHSTQALSARAQGLTPNEIDAPTDTHGGLLADLTGREREFFAITSAWEGCRAGRAKHLHLTAPAGFGKSRLLRDACSRLAAGGAQVVRVQGTAGDRDVPYAFAADLASALSSLSGASGIAPASAATLLALNPALSSRYSAAPDSAQGEEALRRRIHALVDLVHSVAHEQSFVLAIDDLHWIDQASYRVLEGVFARLEGAHLLCLTAARPERQPMDEGCTILRLAALSPSQLANLVSALGALPDAATWTVAFIVGLHQATGGSPLLVLETLRFAIDQGILSLDHHEWHCIDEGRLHALLQAGEALRERVRALPPNQSWLLALLATAGTPLELEPLALATSTSPAGVLVDLAPLEHHGLIVRSGMSWRVAHDEIAAAARAALTPEQHVAADRIIGEYYARARDSDSLLRAVRHFLAANDQATVQRLHREFALHAKQRGDHRSFSDLAAELIGRAPATAEVAALVRTLPWSWRIGLWSLPRQAAAAAVLLLLPAVGVGVVAARRSADATLQQLNYADSTGTTSALGVRRAGWEASAGPLLPALRTSLLTKAALGYSELPPAISPDGASAAWVESSGDSTTLDIWIRTPSGVRRLTRQPRDDLVQGWLPDGSALVGTTNRWSPPLDGNYNIAVFDTATGAARRVTRGSAQETNPYVSPDGTRVAFERATRDDPPMLCVSTIDGVREPECRLIGGQPIASVQGWIGLDEIVVTTDEPNARALVSYDWRRDVRTVLLAPYAFRARLSPDRRWIVASARVEGVSGLRDVVFPLDAPGKAREVADPGKTRGSIRWWEGRADPSLLIDRLEFSDSVRDVLPGIGTRLIVRALSATGIEIPLRAPLTWTSSDTLIATVDSAGEVRVRSIGTVTISATLVGRRSVSKALTVVGKPPVDLLSERWDDHWTDRWLAWGDPRPVVTNGPQGIRGLWNHGDGTYPSMAVSRDAVSARDGMGLEVRISTPLSGAQHQRLSIRLVTGADIAALEGADPQDAPPYLPGPEAICSIVFPGEEGRWGATRIAATGGVAGSLDLGAAAAGMRTGEWWTLRLQLLPDGRCGVAINNRVIWLSSEPIQLTEGFRIWLGDESAGTRLLHGPLQLWSGVRTDISWASPEK